MRYETGISGESIVVNFFTIDEFYILCEIISIYINIFNIYRVRN